MIDKYNNQGIDTKVIEEILSRGNTAEIKKNKNGILILEVKKQIKSGK